MSASGKSTNEIQSALRVPPFVAKRIVAQVRRADGERLERALIVLADLDYAVRGAGNLDSDSALTLAVDARGEPRRIGVRPRRSEQRSCLGAAAPMEGTCGGSEGFDSA